MISKKTLENRSFTGLKQSDLGKLLESSKKKKTIPILEPIKAKSRSRLSEYHINRPAEASKSKSPTAPTPKVGVA